MIKILLCDNHALVREGLKMLLRENPEYSIIQEAANGEEAVSLAKELKPDLVILDIMMPVMGGIQATRKIKALNPETRVLVLTRCDSVEYLLAAQESGATGYVLKDAPFTVLSCAIQQVLEGKTFLCPSMAEALIQAHKSCAKGAISKPLTPREEEVLKLLAEGHGTRQIASLLEISLKTVLTHRSHILEKLGFSNTAELIKYAIRKGIVSIEE